MDIADQFAMFDLVSVGTCVVKSDFSVVHWNKIMEEWTGISKENIIGKDITEKCPGLNSPICKSRLKALTIEGTPVIFSPQLHKEIFPARLPNGEKRIHNTTVSAISLEDDEKLGALFTVEDVTAISRSMNSLLENRNFLKDVFNSIQDGICVKNADLTIRYANHIIKEKYAGGQYVIGKKCYKSFFMLDEPCDDCPCLRCIESGKTETSIRQAPPNSDAKWIELFAYPLKNPTTGKTTGVINYIRDITEPKEKEEELREAKKAAEAASIAKSEFLANMSHEIRTPLNVVIGAADLIMETELTDKQLGLVEMFQANSELLLSIVNNIIDISRIESGKIELEYTDFDLKRLVKKIHGVMSSRARKKGLKFNLHVDPDLPAILKGDPVRFQQVMINLIGNAIKFTHRGYVKINCGYAQDDASCFLFSVKDSGIGLPKDKMASIFDAFTQADASTTRGFGGTGLGLSIAKKLVELMGGQIWVESKPRQGSTFYFTAKFEVVSQNLETDTAVNQKIAKAPIVPGLSPDEPLKMLLVDDYEHNLTILLHYLKGENFVIDTAEDGVEALEKFKTEQYDIVLMDMQMPVMDGYDATRHIRMIEKEQKRDRTPVIAVSAYALKGELKKSIDAGCDDHLNKPVKKSKLMAMLAKHLQPKDDETESSKERAEESPSYPVVVCDPILKELIPDYLGHFQKRIWDMNKALIKNDYEPVEEFGHNIKGSGGGYGFEEITRIGALLEAAAQKKDRQAAGELLNDLLDYVTHVEVQYEK
jgi:PAS domain S-box-containing protein